MTKPQALKRRIYLDAAAATPLDRRVKRAMTPFLTSNYGNPSSIHQEGLAAEKALAEARRRAADFLSAQPDEIIFTSGGTEGNNLCLKGFAQAHLAAAANHRPGHLVVSAIEHQSILGPARELERWGWAVTYLPVDAAGLVSPKTLAENLRPDTALVSVMLANNEIGAIQPVKELMKVIRHQRKTKNQPWPYFHTDACQATRFIDLNALKLGVDLLTLNGSKIYGPKGSGLVYVRRGTPLEAALAGGGQERGRRSGTENLPAIVGLVKALEICRTRRVRESRQLTKLRDYFIAGLKRQITGLTVNGDLIKRLPNNINVTIAGVNGEQLVIGLDYHGVACSTGSACSAQTKPESYVIMALGRNESAAENSVRFSFGRELTGRDLAYVLKILPALVAKIRSAGQK